MSFGDCSVHLGPKAPHKQKRPTRSATRALNVGLQSLHPPGSSVCAACVPEQNKEAEEPARPMGAPFHQPNANICPVCERNKGSSPLSPKLYGGFLSVLQGGFQVRVEAKDKDALAGPGADVGVHADDVDPRLVRHEVG